jgi:hypothetical protein
VTPKKEIKRSRCLFGIIICPDLVDRDHEGIHGEGIEGIHGEGIQFLPHGFPQNPYTPNQS